MKYILSLLLLFGVQFAFAQGEPPLDELEVEGELIEDDFDDEDDVVEPPAPRNPPPPMRSNRFRNSSKRFGSRRGGSRSGGGVDRLGKTEGKIQFQLVDPPKYFKRKNRPYVMPPSN